MRVLQRLGELVSQRPWWTISAVVVVTGLMILGAALSVASGRSELRTDINEMFPTYKEVKAMEQIESDFGNMEPFIILVEADDVLDPKVFERTYQLESRLKQDKLVLKSVLGKSASEQKASFYSLPAILAGYKVMAAQGRPNPSDAEIEEAVSGFETDEEIKSLYRSYMRDSNISDLEKDLARMLLPKKYNASSTSTSAGSMVTFVALDAARSDKIIEKTEIHMRDDIIAEFTGDGIGLYPYAFGLFSDSYNEAEKETEPLFALAIALVFMISLANYRRLSDTLLANFTVLLVVIWTFCVVGLLGFDYSMFNIMVPLLLTGLAIDFSFHGLMGYRERLADGGEPASRLKKAAALTISFVGVAFLLATITTASGFLSNASSDLPMITEFGLIAGLGIVFICLLNLTFVPAVRVAIDLRRLKKGKMLDGIIPHKKIAASPGRFLGILCRTLVFPWFGLFALVLILLSVPGYFAAKELKASYDPTGELLETQNITKAFKTVNNEFAFGTESILIRIDGNFEDPKMWSAVEQSIKNADDDQYLAKVDGSASVEWIGTLLPSLARVVPEYQLLDSNLDGVPDSNVKSSELRQILDGLAKVYPSLNQYIHKGRNGYDGIVVRVMSRTNIGEHGLDARDELEADLRPVYEREARVEFTGEPIIWNKGIDEFSDSLISSTTLVMVFAATLLLLVYGVAYRSPLLGFLTAMPAFAAVGWTLGIMWMAGIPLNMMTAFVGSLTVGLGIDYPIHLVTRWADERIKGKSVVECYSISMRSTGKELFFSALTTLSAFIAFSLMPMPAMKQFGMVMVISIVLSFLAAVLMMPVLMRFWHRQDLVWALADATRETE